MRGGVKSFRTRRWAKNFRACGEGVKNFRTEWRLPVFWEVAFVEVGSVPHYMLWFRHFPFNPYHNPACNYIFNVNNRNTRARCQIWTYLTPCSSVSIVNFKQVNADREHWSLSNSEMVRKPEIFSYFQGV